MIKERKRIELVRVFVVEPVGRLGRGQQSTQFRDGIQVNQVGVVIRHSEMGNGSVRQISKMFFFRCKIRKTWLLLIMILAWTVRDLILTRHIGFHEFFYTTEEHFFHLFFSLFMVSTKCCLVR